MWGHRVVVPIECREKVLRELHDTHMGIVKTKALARSYVWFSDIDEALEAMCRECEVCAAVADAPLAHAPHRWPWPGQLRRWPRTRLHIDFLGPIAGLTYMVAVDSSSKWIEAIKMGSITAKAVINKLREFFARFGPEQLVSDNFSSFQSEEFGAFFKSEWY